MTFRFIPVDRSRIAGAKYFIHEEKLKRNPNEASSSKNEVKFIKIKIDNSVQNSEIQIKKDTLPTNYTDSKRNFSTENYAIGSKEQQTSGVKSNSVMSPPGRKAFNLINNDALPLNENDRKKNFSPENDAVGSNEQQAEFNSNTVFPTLDRNTRKRKRKRKKKPLNNEKTKLHKACPLCPSPAGTGSLTQSIFQYKNYQENDAKDKTSKVIPFALSDDSSSISMGRVINILPFHNSKDKVSSEDKDVTIVSNSATENKFNNTSLISSNYNPSDKVLNVESYVPLPRPCETTITLSESSKESRCEGNFLHNSKLLSPGLKKYTSSQSVPAKYLNSEANRLKANVIHSSLPIPLIDLLDSSDTSEDEITVLNTYDSKSSQSLLENYCTAIEFTHTSCSEVPNSSSEIVKGKEKSSFEEIQNLKSKSKISGTDLHNVNCRPVPEFASSEKIIQVEPKSVSDTLLKTPIKGSNIVLNLDKDGDAILIKSKQASTNLQQEIFLPSNDSEGNMLDDTFKPVYTSTQESSSSQSSDSSSHVEYLNEESKICLGKIVKV